MGVAKLKKAELYYHKSDTLVLPAPSELFTKYSGTLSS